MFSFSAMNFSATWDRNTPVSESSAKTFQNTISTGSSAAMPSVGSVAGLLPQPTQQSIRAAIRNANSFFIVVLLSFSFLFINTVFGIALT